MHGCMSTHIYTLYMHVYMYTHIHTYVYEVTYIGGVRMISNIRPEIAQVYTPAETVIHKDFILISPTKKGK
jgi:hypothetical protein